ncbi:MAG: M50 family metallopeptidase, partial [Chloroflexota bacterium]
MSDLLSGAASSLPGLALTLAAFFGVLLALVMVHELGHFVTAKRAGVNVQEFGFGYPPRLFGIHYKGTDYTINLLPLGGFVRMLGEEDPGETGSFASKAIPVRIIILAAGSFMNAVLPVFLLTASFMVPHTVVEGTVRVEQVAEGSPAAAAGIQPGDAILSVNDREVKSIQDVGYNIQLNLGNEMQMTVRRDGKPLTLQVVPRWRPPAGQGATGIVIGMPDRQAVTTSLALPAAFARGFRETLDMPVQFKNDILGRFAGGSAQGSPVMGPIGIAQVTGEVAKSGLVNLLGLAAGLSMNLAMINILPIPALDGGRIVFVLLEWVRRGRRIPPEREAIVHMVFMGLLLLFIARVSFDDIARILEGK